MPNWCQNSLILHHDDSAMIDRAVSAFTESKLLNEFIPVPTELTDTVCGYMGDADSQRDLVQQQAANIDKYGYPTWYEFCISEHGTKWDVGGPHEISERIDQNTVKFVFSSAWSPPTAAYSKFTDMGFNINAMYYESGMGFCGRWSSDEGDEEYSITGDSAWVMDNIPADIDQEFAISDSMQEWEQEALEFEQELSDDTVDN
jgi:hypothetical protein